jgi:hypothetical protein
MSGRQVDVAASDAALDEKPSAVVTERWAAILVVIKERVLAVPDKLAPELTALTDERQVRDSLKREMHAILKAIHEDIQYAR